MPEAITPELELASLKTLLALRSFGDEGMRLAEALRSKLRTILLKSESSEDAVIDVEKAIRKFQKRIEALDGTADVRREAKRRRMEEKARKASKFIDAEAGEGDESDGAAEGDDE